MHITESDFCGAVKNDGTTYCANRTRHPSGFCPSHRRNAQGQCPPLRTKRNKLELFTTQISRSVGRMVDETPVKGERVYARFGDATLELEWSHGMKAFAIRTTHKGLRDGLTIIPDSSNRIFIRVGER